MKTIYFNGAPCHTSGQVPAAGTKAPDFRLTGKNLNEISLDDYKGKRIVLNVFPSLDTAVCAMSVRTFNKMASEFNNTVVICVSMDLPFAMSRFCTVEGLDDVVAASAFRSPEFARNYGLEITDGLLKGLLARAVLIISTEGDIIYSDIVNEIANEPDYNSARHVLTNDK